MQSSKPARGLALDTPGLFCESYVTKSELARLLDVARSTLVSWDSLAFYRIPTYRDSYPVKVDGASDSLRRSVADRTCPLSPYQSWVLSRIGRVMQNLKSSERVKNYIKNHPQEFTPACFQAQFHQVTRGAA